MKKFGLFLISLLFISTSLMAQSSTITRFEGEPLCGLMVDGAFDVKIVEGNDTKVEVTLPDKLANKLIFELTEDKYVRLALGSKTSSLFMTNKNTPQVRVTLNKLQMLRLSGNVQLLSSGVFSADEFLMVLSEGSNVDFVSVECRRATLDCDDASKADNMKVVATEEVKLETRVAAAVNLKGSAPKITVVSEATSKIDMLSFVCANIIATTSGTSVVKATVSGEADIATKGISAFKYVGDGLIRGEKATRL